MPTLSGMKRHAGDDPHDPSDLSDGSVALEPMRAWDLPAGPHLGSAAAQRVPCSAGAASFELRPPERTPDEMIRAETAIEPVRAMECGTDWTDAVRQLVHASDVPMAPRDPLAELASIPLGRPPLHRIAVDLLIADDSEDVRTCLAELATDAGFSVATASGRRVLVELLHQLTARLVLLDLTMPDLRLDRDAPSLAAQCEAARTRLYALTGHPEAGKVARRHGFVGVLMKPFTAEEFLAFLGSVLGRHPQSS